MTQTWVSALGLLLVLVAICLEARNLRELLRRPPVPSQVSYPEQPGADHRDRTDLVIDHLSHWP
jgi:hypothetical protein